MSDTPETEVVIMRNVAGAAWREAGRTGVCPTPEWLRDQYGDGRYELRLMHGRRLLCVVQVGTEVPATGGLPRPALQVARSFE